MENNFGIDNLKKVAKVVIEVGNVSDKMGHESSWTARIGHITMLLPSLMNLSGVDWNLIDDEIKEINSEEREALIVFFKNELNLIDDELEGVIEDFISIINSAISLVVTSIKLVNRK